MMKFLSTIILSVLIMLIRFYRRFLSPLFAPRCRFYPTCSCYAIEALLKHGLQKGGGLVIKRLLRCHPYEKITNRLGPSSGYDPVPPAD